MSKIDSLVQEFVVNLRAAIAEEAAAAFSRVAMSPGSIGGNGRNAPPRSLAVLDAIDEAATPKAAKLPKGRLRRNADDLDAQLQLVVTYLKNHPSSGIEAIGPAVGLDTKTLAPVMKRGRAQKIITMKGQRRSAKYSSR